MKLTAARLREVLTYFSQTREFGSSGGKSGDLGTAGARLPLRDHRMALLVHDATRYRQAQQKAKDAAPSRCRWCSGPARRRTPRSKLSPSSSNVGSLKDAAA